MFTDYKELIVWQKSIDFTVLLYKLLKKFPKDEVFGLVNQLKRASVSISSNIAEGSRRGGLDSKRFLKMAFGSASEVGSQLCLAYRLDFLSEREYTEISMVLEEILKMLNKISFSNNT
jgi:four helix bundle protein